MTHALRQFADISFLSAMLVDEPRKAVGEVRPADRATADASEVVGLEPTLPMRRASCPSTKEHPLPPHTHFQIRKAILIVVIFAIFAWLVMVVADTDNAGSADNAAVSTTTTTSVAYVNAVPGSSLEGINEPLQKIIDEAAAAEQARVAAERAAVAAKRASQIAVTQPAAPRPTNPDCAAAETALRSAGANDSEIGFALPIAQRESNCTLGAVNQNSGTGDNSWGPWQINYYGNLYDGRVAMLGTPDTNTSSWDRAAQNFLTLLRSSGRCHWIPPRYCAG